MVTLFYIVGALSVLMAIASIGAMRSDIQLILAGVFLLAAITAFGFAAVLNRMDYTMAQKSQAYKDQTA